MNLKGPIQRQFLEQEKVLELCSIEATNELKVLNSEIFIKCKYYQNLDSTIKKSKELVKDIIQF